MSWSITVRKTSGIHHITALIRAFHSPFKLTARFKSTLQLYNFKRGRYNPTSKRLYSYPSSYNNNDLVLNSCQIKSLT